MASSRDEDVQVYGYEPGEEPWSTEERFRQKNLQDQRDKIERAKRKRAEEKKKAEEEWESEKVSPLFLGGSASS